MSRTKSSGNADKDRAGRELFGVDLRKDGKPVVTLSGVEADQGVTVEAAVHHSGTTEPERRRYGFESRAQATRFLDDAVLALEYLDCTVSE